MGLGSRAHGRDGQEQFAHTLNVPATAMPRSTWPSRDVPSKQEGGDVAQPLRACSAGSYRLMNRLLPEERCLIAFQGRDSVALPPCCSQRVKDLVRCHIDTVAGRRVTMMTFRH